MSLVLSSAEGLTGIKARFLSIRGSILARMSCKAYLGILGHFGQWPALGGQKSALGSHPHITQQFLLLLPFLTDTSTAHAVPSGRQYSRCLSPPSSCLLT